MKKRTAIIALCCILGCCSGCVTINYTAGGTQEEITTNTTTTPEVGGDSENNEADKSGTVVLYFSDEMAENTLSESVEVKELTEEVVWDLLKEKEIVPETSKMQAFAKENGIITMDVDEAFGEQLRSMGTTGEIIMIHCVVNTFLDTFECEKIKITENEGVLYSGHAEYSEYFTKFE